MPEQIGDRLAQVGVRFHLPFLELDRPTTAGRNDEGLMNTHKKHNDFR
jgi:hypothetical protein